GDRSGSAALSVVPAGAGDRADRPVMYGEEKSDSLIVAANLANNPQGAESVERRSGAKGNAEQPHMRRTQSLRQKSV
ncbi:hypothetical protein FK521_28865, partial [Klebsiella pneumoniae]|nr:hypothetical protein [Klebsiella pneumoniae]